MKVVILTFADTNYLLKFHMDLISTKCLFLSCNKMIQSMQYHPCAHHFSVHD